VAQSTAFEIGIVGAGAWGTTLASLLTSAGCHTIVWAYESDVANDINKSSRNSVYLHDVDLPPGLVATNDFADLSDPNRLIIAVPSPFLAETLEQLAPHVKPGAELVSATKGFVASDLKRPSQLLEDILPGHSIGVLSGPNLSREIIRGLPAISLVASKDDDLVREYQRLLSTARFRVYGGKDVVGTELGGALKNIMAIAAGLADGLELGENALAALITRGLAEMIRLGKVFGADERTFYGVSGLGDLVCTSQSRLSRNHEVGRRLAAGESLDAVLQSSKAVPEGVGTTGHVHEFAFGRGLDLPITAAVHAVLFERAEPANVLRELMTRELKME